MEQYLLGVKIGLIALSIIGGFFGIIALVYFMAKLNIFWTLVKEGTAKAVLRNDEVQKIVMAYKDYYLDEEWNVVRGEDHHWLGGLRWIGIPIINTIHEYNFSWTSYEQVQENGKAVAKPKTEKEKLDFIFVKDDLYFTLVEAAETKGMVPVDAALLLTLRVVNPYKALFRVQHWLEATLNRVKPAFRSFISGLEFEEAVAKKEEVEEKAKSFIHETKVDEFLLNNYGVEIKAIEVVTIDPSGERGKIYVEAASKAWEAQKELTKIQTLADAEVARIRRTYETIKGFGEEGMFLRTLETIEKAGQEPGKFVIFPMGSLKDIMSAWTGRGTAVGVPVKVEEEKKT